MQAATEYIKIKPRKKKRKWRETGFLVSVWIYPIALFALLYVAVNIGSIMMAFQTFNTTTQQFEWTTGSEIVANFRLFIDNIRNSPDLAYVFRNSIIIYAVTMLISMPVNICVSYFLFKKIYGHEIFKILLFLPSLISSIVWVFLFRYLVEFAVPAVFGENIHLLSNSNANVSFWTMLFFSTWIGFAGGMLIYLGSMSRISESLIEAGKIDGLTTLQELRYVALPLIYPLLSVMIITSVPGFFTNSLHIFAFYDDQAPREMYTLGYYLFIRVIGSDVRGFEMYPYAAAGGLLITLIVAPLTFFVKWLVERFDPEATY